MLQLVKPDLYDPARVHDACGFGFVARVDGRRTRETVEEGLEVLCNLDHRGASGSDPETGDGAGILLRVPDAFLRQQCASLGVGLPPAGGYGVGMLFEFEGEEGPNCEGTLERIVAEEGQRFLGWRTCRSSRMRPGAWRRVVCRASGSSLWRTVQETRRPSSGSCTRFAVGSKKGRPRIVAM